MTGINSYANDLLLEFLDAAHTQVKATLQREFGDDWLVAGVERHLNPGGLARAREMLNSPMAVVDMGKADDEIYGVEHLANIVSGNWALFGDGLGDRDRSRVYLGEVAELRHNVSHRRQHHMLRRRDLLRFVRNAEMLLRGLQSSEAPKFDSIAAGLEQGGSPWGAELGGTLPPATEIVPEFVGREDEIRDLSVWLADNSERQIVIWGYGGSGKSALAYQVARAVRDGAPSNLQAVVWLSAKSREYVEGETRDRRADFDSVASFAQALWAALYDAEPSIEQASSAAVVRELTSTPSLVVVDDLDSVLDIEVLANFLLFEVRRTNSRIIYTSRQRVPGLRTIEVAGFDDNELASFVRSRSREHELDVEQCLARLDAIRSVTDAFPLFVDDLLRHARLGGLENAIGDWSQRRGDAAREYALRRQLSALGEAARRALIGVAVANRPVSSIELATISGFTDDDTQHAIQALLNWRLLTRLEADATGRPTFSCNRNTARLVQKTFSREPVYGAYRKAFETLSGSPLPSALRKAVGIAISEARAQVLRGDFDGAAESLRAAMTGELEENADLWGALGWVLSRRRDEDSTSGARFAFQRAHALGSRKEDTYYHWVMIERDVAEKLVGQDDDAVLLGKWREAALIAEQGIERCGETPSLCHSAAYLSTREAKTLERLKQFTSAQTCFRQGAEWARRALAASNPSSREVNRTSLYRTLVIALEGSGEPERAVEALVDWRSAVGSTDLDWRRERDRLASIPEFRGMLP